MTDQFEGMHQEIGKSAHESIQRAIGDGGLRQVHRKRCTGVPLNDTVNSDGIV
jgi:hypothetical protein